MELLPSPLSLTHTPKLTLIRQVVQFSQQVSSSQVSEEEEFSRGPWAVMKTEMGLDEKNPSCFLHSYSVVMVLRKVSYSEISNELM